MDNDNPVEEVRSNGTVLANSIYTHEDEYGRILNPNSPLLPVFKKALYRNGF
jgi:hypothetical protein